MSVSPSRVVTLEWANYAATAPVADVTPGLDLDMGPDAILTASQVFPMPDTTHACLLRADAESADALIERVVGYFGDRNLPVTVYLSPACTPPDLEERLRAHGFVRQEGQEAWMVLEKLSAYRLPRFPRGVMVREARRGDAITVAETFMRAFGWPTDYAPLMAQLLEPSVDLDTVHHYLALIDGQAAGTCSLLRWGEYGVLGSAGVLPEHRGGGAATALSTRAASDARAQGVETLMLQTEAGTPLERLLRINGFSRAFVRACYTLT